MSSDDFSPDKPMSIDKVAFFKMKKLKINEKKLYKLWTDEKNIMEGMCVFQGF